MNKQEMQATPAAKHAGPNNVEPKGEAAINQAARNGDIKALLTAAQIVKPPMIAAKSDDSLMSQPQKSS